MYGYVLRLETRGWKLFTLQVTHSINQPIKSSLNIDASDTDAYMIHVHTITIEQALRRTVAYNVAKIHLTVLHCV